MTLDLFIGSFLILTLAALAIITLTTRRRGDRNKNSWSSFRPNDDDHDNLTGT
ncbi:MAG: hypothetical protein OTI35_09855 [Sulfitobacter sp.]|nr:hypothetical protein [Sulfitobacter sp.]